MTFSVNDMHKFLIIKFGVMVILLFSCVGQDSNPVANKQDIEQWKCERKDIGCANENSDATDLCLDYCFGPAIPNPTAGVVTIPLTVPERVFVSLYVFRNGYEQTLIQDTLPRGIYEVVWDGRNVMEGLYLFYVVIGGWESNGMVLVKR